MNTALRTFAAASGLLVAMMAPALAQEGDAAVPSSTVETYGAWDVNCVNVKEKAKADPEKKDAKKKAKKKDDKKEEAKTVVKEYCETVQVFRNKKTKKEYARFSLDIRKQDDGTI